MPAKITYLEVRPDAESHARRFGAKRNSAGKWYVAGQVPNELLNYLPGKTERSMFEPSPECPVCWSSMRKEITRSGNLHWICTQLNQPDCPGRLDYADYLERMVPLPVLGEQALAQVESLVLALSPPEVTTDSKRTKHPLNKRWEYIVTLAFRVLGNERQVMRWMTQPKLSLGRKTPMQALGTAKGCGEVKRLLRELWD